MKKRQLTFDGSASLTYERTPQGYLRAKACVGRVGVLKYQRPDGTVMRQLRAPEELFKPESLESLASIPVTSDHPACKLLNATNTSRYIKGFTSSRVEVKDDRLIETDVTVTDADLISEIEAGKTELSPGYTCYLDPSPGIWEGEPYDVVQRDIVYNHCASVWKGRAGREVSLQLDADDVVEEPQPKEKKPMKKMKVGDAEFEVSDELAAALEKQNADTKAQMDGMQKQLDGFKGASEKATKDAKEAQETCDSLQAKLDTAEDKLKKALEATNNDSAEAFQARVDERVRVLSVAEVCLDAEDLKDAKKASNVELMKKIIKAEFPERNLDGKSEAYLQATFDSIAEEVEAQTEKKSAAGRGLVAGKAGSERAVNVDAAAAREKAMEDAKKLSQEPLTGRLN